MTIRDIAALANVSASTVSKILNKKYDGISEETRRRVLEKIKEYNYTPHAKYRPNTSSRLLGVSMALHTGHEQLMTSLIGAAREEGYTTIITTSAGPKDEEKNLAILCSHHVDGIVWDRVADSSDTSRDTIQKQGIPLQITDAYRGFDNGILSVDYSSLGYAATQKLIERKHQRLGCVMSRDSYTNNSFTEGFRRCLFDYNIPYEEDMVQVLGMHEEIPYRILNGFTGMVCADDDLALRLKKQADSYNLMIPRDLSIVSLSRTKNNGNAFGLSAIDVPFDELGRRCIAQLIGQIEKRPLHSVPAPVYELNHTNSLDIPGHLRGSKILVIGSINMDTFIPLNRIPRMGETVTADNRMIIPGGKGLNQAVAASKLGMETYLIGKIGKDHDGSVLFDYLKTHHINTEAVTSDPNAPTGTAYIYVRTDGESSIVVYKGANQHMRARDVDRFDYLFANVSYCLLQTEISPDMAEYAAQTARKHHAKVILKPCSVSELSDTLLARTNILLPNENEASRLLGEELSYEEKAQYFLDKGVETVIITLGAKGCYLKDAGRSQYFKAADVVAADTTGASDAFAATLAVYLSRGYAMETAVSYATYAAGLSTTRQGVPPALVDQSALNFYSPNTIPIRCQRVASTIANP